MQKITPFLWFDGRAEEAMNFYTRVFRNAKTGSVRRFGEAGPESKGSVMSATFELEGLEFIALNGGPHFKFTPAISFFVNCTSQDEVDYYWEKLAGDGGQTQQCGWLQDKFGVSWQIVPNVLGEMLGDKDATRSRRVMEAMMKMTKLDIKTLQAAYNQR